jgi:ATP-dependent Lhr-like helicase
LGREASLILDALKKRGASFIADLVRFTDLRKPQVEAALWELVTAGLVTADGFDNLRSLLGNRNKRRPISRTGAGRWSILHPSDEQADPQKRIDALCRVLLNRYGVVFRDLTQRESLLPRWRELQLAFRRMEDRGEVRGGRFVSGFIGEQFAMPLAVDSLRAIRKMQPSGEIVSVSAADPLNLIGIILPGERIPAVSHTLVSYRDGVPLPAVEIETA